jgi:hypothetical protein
MSLFRYLLDYGKICGPLVPTIHKFYLVAIKQEEKRKRMKRKVRNKRKRMNQQQRANILRELIVSTLLKNHNQFASLDFGRIKKKTNSCKEIQKFSFYFKANTLSFCNKQGPGSHLLQHSSAKPCNVTASPRAARTHWVGFHEISVRVPKF